jgi:superfamily II RNA helicase
MSVTASGSIIRCMRRLEEAMRQMVGASKAIGNTELENKFVEGAYGCSFFKGLNAEFSFVFQGFA